MEAGSYFHIKSRNLGSLRSDRLQLSSTNMNTYFAFCILTAFCAGQVLAKSTNSTNTTNPQVNASISDIKSVIQNLENSTQFLETSTKKKLDDLVSTDNLFVNTTTEKALNYIRVAVDAAEAVGKNVESCYTNAESDFFKIIQSVTLGFQECEEKGLKNLKQLVHDLVATESNGTQIVEELESIVPGCVSLNVLQADGCIVMKYNNVSKSIETFKNNVILLLEDSQANAAQIVASATNCTNTYTKSFVSKATNEVKDSFTCINS